MDSLELVNPVMDVAYRNHKGKNISQENLHVWLRKGEIDASRLVTEPYDAQKLHNIIAEIRSFTYKNPHDYLPDLEKKLADCGVAIVFTPNLPNTYVCGAARWLSSTKALVQLSLRGAFADIMWFTLFHEVGHILLHNKKTKHIDFVVSHENSKVEEEANKFASDMLIPPSDYNSFLNSDYSNPVVISDFAKNEGVHPGIVIGRLQHDGKMPFNHLTHLRERYKFIEKKEN